MSWFSCVLVTWKLQSRVRCSNRWSYGLRGEASAFYRLEPTAGRRSVDTTLHAGATVELSTRGDENGWQNDGNSTTHKPWRVDPGRRRPGTRAARRHHQYLEPVSGSRRRGRCRDIQSRQAVPTIRRQQRRPAERRGDECVAAGVWRDRRPDAARAAARLHAGQATAAHRSVASRGRRQHVAATTCSRVTTARRIPTTRETTTVWMGEPTETRSAVAAAATRCSTTPRRSTRASPTGPSGWTRCRASVVEAVSTPTKNRVASRSDGGPLGAERLSLFEGSFRRSCLSHFLFRA